MAARNTNRIGTAIQQTMNAAINANKKFMALVSGPEDNSAGLGEEVEPDIANVSRQGLFSALLQLGQLLGHPPQGLNFSLRAVRFDLYCSPGLFNALIGIGLGQADVRRNFVVHCVNR